MNKVPFPTLDPYEFVLEKLEGQCTCHMNLHTFMVRERVLKWFSSRFFSTVMSDLFNLENDNSLSCLASSLVVSMIACYNCSNVKQYCRFDHSITSN